MIKDTAGMNQVGSIQVREGDLLAGKYRIERVLGVGGMGIVVAARHEELDQLVVIKFVRDESLASDEAVERFLRESRSAARLRSEHVARVLDVGRLASGAPYMVMEFLEGSDLGQVLTREGPMPLDLAVALMLQVCEAVAEAHAAGIVHRDLKPENLFLTRTVGGSPRMKVLDFGVSKSVGLTGAGNAGNLTRTRAVLGSPLYMAPEQMRSSRDVDARIDIWALGVVLFELLTSRSPFEAETLPELCLKVVGEEPLSIHELRPDLPPALVAVVARCLEKDRDKRYANAAELATALQPFAPANALRLRSSLDGPSGIPGSYRGSIAGATAPSPTPTGPVLTPSIPAAWGTEGRRESQKPTTPRRRAAWLVVPLLGVAAAVAIAALRLSGDARPAVATAAAPPALSTPPVNAVASPPASLAEPPEVVASPPARESAVRDAPLASAASAPAFTAARGQKPPDGGEAAARVAPVDPKPARPLASGQVPAHPAPIDDDIPALR